MHHLNNKIDMQEHPSSALIQGRSHAPSTRILACGYRQCRIVKTGNRFPAWLVLIPSSEKKDDNDNTSNNDRRIFVWRTKRDFLLLSRAVAECSISQCPCSNFSSKLRTFPKTAFSKLSDRAPWRMDLEDMKTFLESPRIVEEVEQHPTNRYHISMKKNLFHMDQFLQAIHLHASFNTDTLDEAGRESLEKAWNEFCRPCDSSGVILDYGKKMLSSSAIEMLPTPQALGQYFCTTENANQLVQLLFKNLTMSMNTQPSEHLVILEPSCGHGQVIWTLMEAAYLRQLQQQFAKITILGMDLDPRVIEVCQRRENPKPDSELLQIKFFCTDFLSTKRASYIDEGDGAKVKIVALGGPPYGSKPEERDLPVRFVKHCINEWKARAVAFILPRRFQDWTHDDSVSMAYTSEMENLLSSTFYYEGKTPVSQPSRLQCWFRN